MAPTSCPGCGSAQWRSWHQLRRDGDWRYVRCAGCGLARLDPMPQPEVLAEVFDDGYFHGGGARGGYDDYDADAATHRANATRRLSRLTSSAGPGTEPPLLVDVGCASGYTLDAARERGWRGVGVEVSPTAADRARAKGFRVESNLAALEDLAGTADAVCFFQVLEHLPQPDVALTQAARLLRPGGVVLCETWDGSSRIARLSGARWQQLSPPSVLWVFDRASAGALFSRAGLAVDSWRRTSKLVSLGLVLGQLGPRLPAPLASAAAGAARRFGSVRVRYGLGDLVNAEASRAR